MNKTIIYAILVCFILIFLFCLSGFSMAASFSMYPQRHNHYIFINRLYATGMFTSLCSVLYILWLIFKK